MRIPDSKFRVNRLLVTARYSRLMPRAPEVGDRFRVPRGRFISWLRSHPEEEPANGRDYPATLTKIHQRGAVKFIITLEQTGEEVPCSKTELQKWAHDFDDELQGVGGGQAQLSLAPAG